MNQKELEREIYESLGKQGSRVPNQIGVDIGYPLSASPKDDRRFFEALGELERKGLVEWYPTREVLRDSPGLKIIMKAEFTAPAQD